MNIKELEQPIVDYLKGVYDKLDWENKPDVFRSCDFTESKSQMVVVVGVMDVQQINFRLPDYRVKLQVSVNVFVDEDESGLIFKELSDLTKQALEEYTLTNEEDFTLLFPNQGVVCFMEQSFSPRLDPSSRSEVCDIDYELVISE